MNKVYLLLRDNKQTGPHTLEELVKNGIKPFDLIWVEGRSAAWAYPSEIAILKTYVPQASDPQVMEKQAGSVASSQAVQEPNKSSGIEIPPIQKATSPKKVYVSLPAKRVQAQETVTVAKGPDAVTLEQRAEELRKRAQSYVRETTPTATPEPVQTKYSRNVGDLEEQYTSWVYKQKVEKRNKFPKKRLGMGIATLLLLAGGYGIAKYLFNTGEDTSTKIEVAAKENSKPLVDQQATQVTAVQQAAAPEDPSPVVPEQGKKNSETNPLGSVKKKNSNALQQQAAVKAPVLITKRAQVPKETADPQGAINNEVASQSNEDEHVSTTQTQKAKTFGQKLSGFFNKFKSKKEEVQPVDESQRTTRDPKTSERKARRRGDDAPASTEMVNLAEFVDITANEPSDNWMLGIHGLKLTVHNRSDETIRTAVVEVRYYNEQKELLEKKTVNFTNIPPGKSATSAAPDHRLAELTDYRLVSAGN